MVDEEDDVKVNLCYNCKVILTNRSCIIDDEDIYHDSVGKNNDEHVWDEIRNTAVYNYRKAMILATSVSSKLSEVINFGKYMLYDSKLDPFDDYTIDYYNLNLPNYILRCNRCYCFYSTLINCHCINCINNNKPPHYIILMHGVLSSPIDMYYCLNILLEKNPMLFIYLPGCVAGKSLFGMNFILKLLSNELNILFNKLPLKVRISLIGHSFGGILLRYWHLFYIKWGFIPNDLCSSTCDSDNKLNDSFDNNDFTPLDIEWINLITLATPHAGIFENAIGFKKLISLIGSNTINELNNDTIDLLFLLNTDGLKSLKKFKNLIFYGNICGDHMVAPRTSIILPYWAVDKLLMDKFTQITEKKPGKPHYIPQLIKLIETNTQEEIITNEPSSTGGIFKESSTSSPETALSTPPSTKRGVSFFQFSYKGKSNNKESIQSPPEVTTADPTGRGASSNYLSLKGDATPGDRGEGSDGSSIMGMMEDGAKDVLDLTSSGSGTPVADLWEAEGQLKKEATTASGKTTSGGESDGRNVTSGETTSRKESWITAIDGNEENITSSRLDVDGSMGGSGVIYPHNPTDKPDNNSIEQDDQVDKGSYGRTSSGMSSGFQCGSGEESELSSGGVSLINMSGLSHILPTYLNIYNENSFINKLGNRENCIDYFIKKFYNYLIERIKKTPHVSYLYHNTPCEKNYGDVDLNEFLKIFTRYDLEHFNSIITLIVMNSSNELLIEFDKNDKQLYTEVILTILYKLGIGRYAIYIPLLHVPHRTIVMNIDGPIYNYTLNILTHLSKHLQD